MPRIEIGGKTLGPLEPVFIIAEAGVNHNGNLEFAKSLVDAAVASGADAVKFQTFTADALVCFNAPKAAYQSGPKDESQRDMLRNFELTFEQHQVLANYCQERGILFLSTPFDLQSFQWLERLGLPAYKVGSGDLTNLLLLHDIAVSQKPVLLSTGMASLGEVEEAVECLRQGGNDQIILLHCLSSYPALTAEVNLRAMLTLQQAFGVLTGYSDHTLGYEAAWAAVALGARVLEKHLTLQKSLPGPDQCLSLEPDEFTHLVEGIRNVEKALGDGRKRCMDSEAEVRNVARKSVVTVQDVMAGTVLTREMLTVKRPGTGIAPKYLERLIGRTTRRFIGADCPLEWNDLVPF